ncbi:nuclear transport factor 2 family protein [Streptomyces sp. NBC_00841]|uniref:nuclear transport factor 2 family protein n=1 Tax=Streptomyces sp. NBC_00841 TaxID=2975847 RepID=UPI002DD92D33|nr:nuclear transport factor 2 family protein [Streptomyces sp. NBC_00841]WRZ97014.1 nuclear transport factor 2 family protein [Streptomyces sp. NBC_00841]
MTDAAAAQVLELERRRWEALVASDTGTLHELFAEGMAYTHSNALVDTKSSYIKSIEDGAVSYVGVDSSDEEIRVFGGTAVVTGRAVIDARAGGRVHRAVARYSAVWAQTGGRWQFVCWQSTPQPQQ